MINDTIVTSTYNNKTVELVFNEIILCPFKLEGSIDLQFGKALLDWKMRLIFDPNEGDQPFATKWQYNHEDINIKAILYNWFTATGDIDLTIPRRIATPDESHVFYFYINSKAPTGFSPSRRIHLSVWKES